MKSRKSIYFIAVLILSLFLLFGNCSKDTNNGKKVITFWAMGAEGMILAPFIKEFEDLNPDIKVDLQSVPWSNAHDKLFTAYAGRSMPDVCQLGNTWVSEMKSMDALFPLDSFANKSKIIKKENYFEGFWNTNTIDGILYGIPWYVETRALFYRKDLLAKVGYDRPPDTWEELLDAAKKLSVDSDGDGIIDRFGIYLPINPNLEPIEVIFAFQNDGEILKNKFMNSNVESSEVKEAFNYYVEFFRQGASPLQQNQITNLFLAFQSGIISMFINGPWNMNEIHKRFPDLEGKWAVSVLPMKKNRASNAGGSSLVIFNNSLYKEASWRLIEFLSTPEVQTKFYKVTYDLPAVKKSWDDSALIADPNIRAFYEQLQYAKPAPMIPEMEQIYDKLGMWMEQVIFSKYTMDEAAVRMSGDINRLLEKRRWLNEKK